METRRVSIPIGFSNPLQQRPRDLLRELECVSIPIGFSNPLQPRSRSRTPPTPRVSIPIGFSNPLQLQNITDTLTAIGSFQSLLGFLIRCNYFGYPLSPEETAFQSLLGFLIRCNQRNGAYRFYEFLVSIPIGFSNPLQLS